MKTVVEARLTLVYRGLILAFGSVGLAFFIFPDGTIDVMNQLGAQFGLPEAPHLAHRFWLSLGSAYMAVVTTLAWLIATDPVGRRPMMIALGVGKAVSSLTCLLYFIQYDYYFIYLLNFLVDGSLVLLAALTYGVACKEARRSGGAGGGAGLGRSGGVEGSAGGAGSLSAADRRRLSGILEGMVPLSGPTGNDTRELVDRLEKYFQEFGPLGMTGLKALIGYLHWSPLLFFRRLGTLAGMTVPQRTAHFEAVEASRWVFFRSLLHAFKLFVMMHFYDHEAGERSVGMNPDYLAAKLELARRRRESGETPAIPKASVPAGGKWVR